METRNAYNVGDQVWWARCDVRQVSKLCPICFGKLKVTLVLGNDDTVVLDCDFCRSGFEPSSGSITEHEYVAAAELVTITQVRINETQDGQEREYQNGYYCLDADDLFATEAEALTRCAEKAAKHNEEERTRAEHLKSNKCKSYSWNAGYHLRVAKRAEAEAARHREWAELCQKKARK